MSSGKGKRLVYVSEDLLSQAAAVSRDEDISLGKLVENSLLQAVKVNKLGFRTDQMADLFDVLQGNRVLGGLFVFSLYFILLRRCAMLIKTAKDGYASCIAAGLMGMYFFHFMVNAGMAMGIMPVTGIPLFFLSYGGSCMWTAMAGIGLLLGISARRFRT